MRIAYLSTFYPFRGGIAQFNHALYNELVKVSDVKTFTFKRQYPGLLFPGKTQYVEQNDNQIAPESTKCLDTINPVTYLKTARIIYNWQPDLLLMKFWMPFFAPSLGFVSGFLKKRHVKSIAILDNVIPHEGQILDKTLVKYFLNRCSGFVVMSETVKNDLLSLKPDARYILHEHPLYNHFGAPVTPEKAREALGLPHDKKILLFFGFVREYKGLDLLIKTMKKLDDSYLLVVAGEVYGDEKKYLNLAEKENVSDKIRFFFRYIADHEVPMFFSACDVNVLPYKSATQSGILAIAYHFDKPVIVTDTGNLGKAVVKDNTGIVVGPPDVEHLSKGIQQFFTQDQKDYFIQNIKKLKESLSWESFASAILDFYKSL